MSGLDDVIRDFVNDNEKLFDCIWFRDDPPTDQEIDPIADTWEDEYGEVAGWEEVEDEVMKLAEEYDWSSHISAIKEDALYVESDILFDSERDDRLTGRD